MPKAAVDLPLPAPVCTIRSPRSSVLVASTFFRAAWRRCIFSRCCRLISSSEKTGSLMWPPHQLGPHGVSARPPQTALDCFAEAVSGFGERPRVTLCHEFLHRRIAEIGLVQRVEMRVVNGARSGREGKEIIHRGGDLSGAFVAVPHHASDPARVG